MISVGQEFASVDRSSLFVFLVIYVLDGGKMHLVTHPPNVVHRFESQNEHTTMATVDDDDDDDDDQKGRLSLSGSLPTTLLTNLTKLTILNLGANLLPLDTYIYVCRI